MAKLTVKNPPFSNVVAAGVATVSLRNIIGYTLERLVLVLGGTALTKAMLTSIKLKVNGKVIIDDDGTNVDKRMKYRGVYDAAGYLTIDFTEIRARTIIGQMMGAIDTSFGVEDITLEVTIAGATAPTLESYSVLSEPQVDEAGKNLPYRGLIAKVLQYPHSFAGAGKQTLQLPFGKQGGSLIKRLHLFHSGNVSSLEVKANGLVVFDNVAAALNSFMQQENQKTPQANVYTVDFISDNNQSNMLDTRSLRNLELYTTLTGAEANLKVYAELLDPLANN